MIGCQPPLNAGGIQLGATAKFLRGSSALGRAGRPRIRQSAWTVGRPAKTNGSISSHPLASSFRDTVMPATSKVFSSAMTTAARSPKLRSNTSATESKASFPMTTSVVSVASRRASTMQRSSVGCLMAEVIDHSVLHIPNGAVELPVALRPKAVLLVASGIRLDGSPEPHHALGGSGEIGMDARSDAGLDGGTQHWSLVHLGERDGQVRHVGLDLHPELAVGRAAGDNRHLRNELVVAQRP